MAAGLSTFFKSFHNPTTGTRGGEERDKLGVGVAKGGGGDGQEVVGGDWDWVGAAVQVGSGSGSGVSRGDFGYCVTWLY